MIVSSDTEHAKGKHVVRRVLLAAVAATLFVLGAIALTGTVTVHGPRTVLIDCGSALAPDTHEAELYGRVAEEDRKSMGAPDKGIDDLAEAYLRGCDTDLDLRRLWAWPLTGLGALGIFGIVGGAIVRRRRSPQPRD
jgi:hypothetical protein